MPVEPHQENRIPSLDGLRAISIVFVLIGHAAGTKYAYSSSFFRYTGDIANLGVRVFFAISGYLITSLLLKEKLRTGAVSLKTFYVRRVLRIFPAFYFFLAVAAILVWLKILPIPKHDFLYAATFTANFRGLNWNLAHFWSLAVEEQFYLVWPATFALCGSKRAMKIAVAMLTVWPLLRGILALMHIPNPGPSISADGVMAGCLLALLRPRLHENRCYLRFLESRWFAAIPLAMLLLNVVYDHAHGVFYHGFGYLVTICIIIVIDGCITIRNKVIRGLNWKPVAFLGTLSYSIYLWQQIFMNQKGLYIFNYFPLNVILVLSCACASYFVVEKPFLELKNRLQARQKTKSEGSKEATLVFTGPSSGSVGVS
jgi:peptidoglycan/LPS O-acetylase OafA/YrhL